LYIFIKPGGNILTTQARNHPRGARRRPTTTRRRQNHSGENYFDSIEIEKLPDLGDLGKKTNDELRQLAIDTGIKRVPTQRNELVLTILSSLSDEKKAIVGAGILDVLSDGFGFLRQPGGRKNNDDIYVTPKKIKNYGLRHGDFITGQVLPPLAESSNKYYGLVNVETVNGYDPQSAVDRPKFDRFTSVYPDEQIKLETTPKQTSTRLVDMVAPIGKGQRSLIVAPPKAGKTMLLKQISAGITENHPEVYIIVSLIGERPEEVTDMKRSIKGEVFSSTFDEPIEDHCRTAEMALERARRLVESGENVVILLDSLTRLARAYNLLVPSSGKTLSGGMDPNALYPPKNFFGAARNCEDAGSLTIIATALVDTGSRLDDLIYEEFKGTGNMELHLDRRLADRRIWPAIDIEKSGTRHEELLLDDSTLKKVWLLRRIIGKISEDPSSKPTEAAEKILDRMSKSSSNEEFWMSLTQPDMGSQ